jgi:hypothetical protein
MNVELKVPTALCCILELNMGKFLEFNEARYFTFDNTCSEGVLHALIVTHFVREYHYLALT